MQTKFLTGPLGYHFVARAKYPLKPFASRETCHKTWHRLTTYFPGTIACTLMPNHLHIIVWADSVDGDENTGRDRMRLMFNSNLWEPIPEARIIQNRSALGRQIRYVHLNPNRKSLCQDPLQWEWNTHRDYMGAIAHPWPDTARTLKALGHNTDSAGRDAFHHYISADPTVNVRGTAPPRPLDAPILLNLKTIERAAEMITRSAAGAFQKKGRHRAMLMRLLAHEFEVPRRKIAEHFKVDLTATWARGNNSRSKTWVSPLLLTLSDKRLLGLDS